MAWEWTAGDGGGRRGHGMHMGLRRLGWNRNVFFTAFLTSF